MPRYKEIKKLLKNNLEDIGNWPKLSKDIIAVLQDLLSQSITAP